MFDRFASLAAIICLLTACRGPVPELGLWQQPTERAHATLTAVFDALRLPPKLTLVHAEVGGSVHPLDPEGPYATRRYLIMGNHRQVRARVIRSFEKQGLARTGSADTRAWEDEVHCSFSMRGEGRSVFGSLGPPTCHPPRWKEDVYLILHLEVASDLYAE